MSEPPLEPAGAGVELGPDVPPALRQAVAAALAWLDALERKATRPR